MIEMLLWVAFTVLVIGSVTDIKTREVPDWLNFAGIAAGLGIRALYSAWTYDPSFILEGIIGFGVFFGIACAMYYLGQWGGGDSKMLMALGAILGVQLSLDHFMIAFIINSIFVGGVYGLFWCVGLAIKNWNGIHKELHRYHQNRQVRNLKLATYLASIFIIVLSFGMKDVQLVLLILAALLMVLFHLWLLIKAVEKKAMISKRSVNKLTEGDWVVKDVKHRGRYICGPKDLGLTKKQIRRLKRLKFKSIWIKEGIPFIPSFLITFLITYAWGNLILLLV